MPKHHGPEGTAHTAAVQTPAAPPALPESTSFGDKALTVAAIGVAAALIEVELIPGMILGVAAMLAPNLLPKIGNGLRPLVKGAVRAGYNVANRAKESVAEASEQFQDIVAEVKAEQHADGSPLTTSSATGSSETA
jgi:hypothetical protein